MKCLLARGGSLLRIRVILLGFLFSLLLGCRLPETSSPASLLTSTAAPVISTEPGSTDAGIPITTHPKLAPSETPSQIPTMPPEPTATQVGSATPTVIQSIRLAVIGDYGSGSQDVEDVANLIDSWGVDYILTTGDNNYPVGAWETIDWNIGNFYHEYISPYKGDYGTGAQENRFYPTLGNHDWDTDNARPYLEYFSLPGNERYYDVILGPVHVFALNSDWREPDGVGASSKQAQWLRERLAVSTAPWKLVVYHAAAYSSGYQGSTDWMRWPFQEWGATVAIAGHDHDYERLEINGFPYFTNGLGGGAIYNFEQPLPGSQVRYNADYGAMLIVADEQRITFQFINRSSELIDTYTINQ